MSLSDVSHALAQHVRYRVLARYLSRIGLIIILLRLIPILVSGINGEWLFTIHQLLALAVFSAICLPLSRLRPPEDIKRNEVMVISALSFVLAAALEAIPFVGTGLSGIDAFFEAVSGVTTTGFSTMTGLQEHSTGVLFARSWMQWYGRLGVVAFSVALLFLDRGIASRRLAMGEINDSRDFLGNARSHSINLLIIYCVLTLSAIGVLLIAGASPLSAVTHALSGVSTGGFSIYDSSLAAIDAWPVQFLMMLCGCQWPTELSQFWPLKLSHFSRVTMLDLALI